MIRRVYADTDPRGKQLRSLFVRVLVLTNLAMRYPGFAVPLMFASNLLKGMIKMVITIYILFTESP